MAAHQLAAAGGKKPKVLLLEADSCLFPMHVRTLARRHVQQLWDPWYEFRVVTARGCEETDCDFAAGITLTDDGSTLASAWRLSIERANRLSPAAGQLLMMCALLRTGRNSGSPTGAT